MPSCAGKPYRPSNGTEGDMFTARFCARCVKDDFDLETGHGGCSIIGATMLYDIDDKEYPKEWVHDEHGRPVCTAFEERVDE